MSEDLANYDTARRRLMDSENTQAVAFANLLHSRVQTAHRTDVKRLRVSMIRLYNQLQSA